MYCTLGAPSKLKSEYIYVELKFCSGTILLYYGTYSTLMLIVCQFDKFDLRLSDDIVNIIIITQFWSVKNGSMN